MTRGGNEKVSPISVLSDRELEVFQMIGHGTKTSDIADKLCLSVKTVETYKSHLKRKLKLNNSKRTHSARGGMDPFTKRAGNGHRRGYTRLTSFTSSVQYSDE